VECRVWVQVEMSGSRYVAGHWTRLQNASSSASGGGASSASREGLSRLVGTGLSILVQGHDFNLLFDGGSGDDSRGISSTENNSRLLAYFGRPSVRRDPGAVSPAGTHVERR
jgi:hypothetical protein